MTPNEVAHLLRLFAADYGAKFEMNEDTPRLWQTGLANVDSDVGRAAGERVVFHEEWPPTLSKFLDVCQDIQRAMAIEPDPAEVCQYCDHGWVSGAPVDQRYKQPDGTVKVQPQPTVRPCERCNPAGFELWKKRAAAKKRATVAPEDRTYPSNPREGLAHAREALTEVLDRLEATVNAAPPPADVPAPAAAFDARDRMLSYDEAYPEDGSDG